MLELQKHHYILIGECSREKRRSIFGLFKLEENARKVAENYIEDLSNRNSKYRLSNSEFYQQAVLAFTKAVNAYRKGEVEIIDDGIPDIICYNCHHIHCPIKHIVEMARQTTPRGDWEKVGINPSY